MQEEKKDGVWLVLPPLTSIKNEGKTSWQISKLPTLLHWRYVLSVIAKDDQKISRSVHISLPFILGAFLIPYLLFLTFGGVPIFFLEQCVGQFTQSEPVHAWNKLCPLLRGEGASYSNQYTSLIVLQTSVSFPPFSKWWTTTGDSISNYTCRILQTCNTVFCCETNWSQTWCYAQQCVSTCNATMCNATILGLHCHAILTL